MGQESRQPLPLPDKKIPVPVMIIGTFEIGIALLGFMILLLIGQPDGNSIAFFSLLFVYGAMGAGLWAIQEWARFANVVLHMIAVPYVFYTIAFLDAPVGWQTVSQLLISVGIILALTQPAMRHKFQTVIPKQKKH